MRLIDADSLYRVISAWPESVMYKDWVQCAITRAPTAAPPPNGPLALAELRELEGAPIWTVDLSRGKGRWEICTSRLYDPEAYGRTWLAYRRRLEEGTGCL